MGCYWYIWWADYFQESSNNYWYSKQVLIVLNPGPGIEAAPRTPDLIRGRSIAESPTLVAAPKPSPSPTNNSSEKQNCLCVRTRKDFEWTNPDARVCGISTAKSFYIDPVPSQCSYGARGRIGVPDQGWGRSRLSTGILLALLYWIVRIVSL